MQSADIPAGVRLREQAGWNQTPGDWERLLAWEPDGCFVAEQDAQIVGTVTTTVYGPRLAWVGMMLVDSAHRRQGMGRTLLAHALAWLEEVRQVQTCALDATPLGKTLYDAMGFLDQLALKRYEAKAPAVTTAPAVEVPGLRPLRAGDLPLLASLDASAFGADRSRVLRGLFEAHPAHCYVLEHRGVARGYVCARPGARTWYVGPLAAMERAAAETLLRAVLTPLAGQAVAIDVPDDNGDAIRLVEQFGLRPQRPFVRMARGAPLPPLDIRHCYAIAGPEIG